MTEEDLPQGRVRVHYVGYGHDHDEWKCADEVVKLSPERKVRVAESGISEDGESDGESVRIDTEFKPYSLYEELPNKVKKALQSYRKKDPVCRLELGFDAIYFEGLAIRAHLITKSQQAKHKVYSINVFSKMDDLLGKNWYIHGLNLAGDFCFVQPGTVKFYLVKQKIKVDYQLQEDGTLTEYHFGGGHRLVFKFVRGDGTHTQWDSIRRLCHWTAS